MSDHHLTVSVLFRGNGEGFINIYLLFYNITSQEWKKDSN